MDAVNRISGLKIFSADQKTPTDAPNAVLHDFCHSICKRWYTRTKCLLQTYNKLINKL
jgi:hypothetical protein